MGFSVVGVELVGAACCLAAQRLAEATGHPARVAHVPDPSVENAAEARVDAEARADVEPPPRALILQGDLFAARLPPASFDLVYDCQGLHAIPPPMRPPYTRVLYGALRPGGLALVLVGRAEPDAGNGDGVPVSLPTSDSDRSFRSAGADGYAAGPRDTALTAPEEAKGDGPGAGLERRAGGGGQSGDGSKAPRKGPSLMTRAELAGLFAEPEWETVSCRPSRFDLTPAYAAMPQPPPAWCVLARKR
ncbi:hypothetical protein GPECTOR_7g1210 [Gonium pectorale]|uniref:Methyltransferase type 11 domain-containing protein n=1 Tax=Gonium pectorale TaxID=33097 RepID=A0A150GTW3_GONPE|nr:hypothetical protein GPECTOR_7g1210 [Gonium pectorale]|eukprot:KXZ53316.1 hypothetical protein GPECTOR_7g1210 [Gonium pectorale]